MADLRISDLVTASQLKNDDYYEISQSESGTRVSYKTTLLAIAVQIATVVQLTSDLTTDSKTLVGAINELKRQIALIPGFNIVKVNSLPTEDIDTHTLYLVPSQDPAAQNSSDEYINTDGTTAGWELIGSTDIDLSDYYTKLEVDGLLADKLEADDFEANQTASANPITLETKQAGLAKSCAVEMNPIQDLHGYSNPWPGGAGKNKLPFDIDAIKANNTDGTWNGNVYTYNGVVWTVNDNGKVIANGTPTVDTILRYLGSGSTSYAYQLPSADYKVTTGFKRTGSRTTFEIGYRPTGETIQHIFNNNGYSLINANVNLIQLVVREGYTVDNLEFEPMIVATSVSDYTFAPYSNICPISGRTEASVVRTGKNLFGGTFNTLFPLHFQSDTQIVVSAKTDSAFRFGYYDREQNLIDYYGINMTFGDRKYRVITLPKETYYVNFYYVDVTEMQIELGSTATTYEPYSGYEVTIDLNGTRYGGTLDVTEGVLTVDMAMVDLGTLSWNSDTVEGKGLFWTNISSLGAKFLGKVVCEQYKGVQKSGLNLMDNGETSVTNSQQHPLLSIRDDSFIGSSAADFKTAMSGVQLCYELATPTTIQLSPEALTLLKGLNVISTDGDKVQVEFSDIPVGDYSALLDYVKSLEDRIKALEG